MSDMDAKELESPGSRAVFKESCETLIRMLSVFAPHIAEEMWELSGHAGRLTGAVWPEYIESLAAEEEIEIPIQINGKLRGRILVSADVSEDEIKERALGDTKVKSWVGDKTVVKFIVVPKRLVNIVVK
jgi:leucyl-tRNA synthetase